MSKQSRHSPSPTSPPSQHVSKLPKFLQKQNRDRSKSLSDPLGSASTSSLASGSSASNSVEGPPTPSPSTTKSRKSSKFLGINQKDDKSKRSPEIHPIESTNGSNTPTNPTEISDPPVIVEPSPINIPRSRTRSDRPLNPTSDMSPHNTLYASTSSTSRIGDLPTRLSGWFSSTFSTSSNDLSLPNLLSQAAVSPKGRSGSALLTAAKHGKGHLDKAVRYLLDSDATPDKCTDPIWLLGVQHPGYEPPPPSPPNTLPTSTPNRRSSGSPPSLRSSSSSMSNASDLSMSASQTTAGAKNSNPGANWPPVFYADFTTRVWLTYRSQFTPIRDTRLAELPADPADAAVLSPAVVKTRPWNWGAEKGWTSDSGWGCMLRTGQSLLANSLIHLHLGRGEYYEYDASSAWWLIDCTDWRRPPYPVYTADYATYVQIVTWFLDTPSPEAPFSVHRMALAGKELGKDVGQWFGPSTAAGAIKTLVSAFPECGLGVSVATDGVLYQSDVYSASHGNNIVRSPRKHGKSVWGERPVLLLLGIRLGIDGVNPLYYETIKLLYTFPQSVGIAGGRPSSSYYFVGSQADNLFYLDPHHARPAVPLRPAPRAPSPSQHQRETTPDSDREWGMMPSTNSRGQRASGSPSSFSHHHRAPTSPSSVRTGSSTFSYHAPLSPSPLQKEFSTSSEGTEGTVGTTDTGSSSSGGGWRSRSPPASQQQHPAGGIAPGGGVAGGRRRQSASQPGSPDISSDMDHRELLVGGAGGRRSSISQDGHGGLDALQDHYCKAYNHVEMKTFHCDRVRKMPLSGLDPSMLIGFLCRDETDWVDLKKRVADLPRTIFSIQDEPPSWPSDSDDNMGLESICEPDDLDMDMDDEEEEGVGEGEEEDGEQFFDTRSGSASTSSASHSKGGDHRSKSEDVDTEEDPVDPITPGPGSRFDIRPPGRIRREDSGKGSEEFSNEGGDGSTSGFGDDDDSNAGGGGGSGDIDDDWVDPSTGDEVPPPTPSPAPPPKTPTKNTTPVAAVGGDGAPLPIVPVAKTRSSGSTKKSKKSRKGTQIPVPVPMVRVPTSASQQQEHYPFPVSQRPAEEGSATTPRDRSRSTSGKTGGANGKRMHTARARDGGRTQSGGVKGILTDESGNQLVGE